eukprot:1139568-Pelagomonas_calceolata.AAC.1
MGNFDFLNPGPQLHPKLPFLHRHKGRYIRHLTLFRSWNGAGTGRICCCKVVDTNLPRQGNAQPWGRPPCSDLFGCSTGFLCFAGGPFLHALALASLAWQSCWVGVTGFSHLAKGLELELGAQEAILGTRPFQLQNQSFFNLEGA